MNPDSRRRLALALDVASIDEAESLLARVGQTAGVAKIGLELFSRFGPRVITTATERGFEVFLDLKLHDIPETVGRALDGIAELGVRYVTVHAGGGKQMLERAAVRRGNLQVLAVTVLTSLDADDLVAQGVSEAPSEHALRLAQLGQRAGITGFVCAATEVRAMRAALGPDAFLVTPGIRPNGVSEKPDDQKRVSSARQAILDGADLLVVGRPIRDAKDPQQAGAALAREIEAALAEKSAEKA